MGRVSAIYIAVGANQPMIPKQNVVLEAGLGIPGDRYFSESGTFSKKLAGLPDKELTMIESENIDAFNQEFGFDFEPGVFRRNIITEDIRLNELVGQKFTIGNTTLRGVRLCEPCAHLAGVVARELLPGLVNKAGLRVEIVVGGQVYVGSDIQ